MDYLLKRLNDPNFLADLRKNNEVAGYYSPTSGRITYNKVVHKRSFAAFTDIITSIVPIDIVMNTDLNHVIPSIAKVLKGSYKYVYPTYLYMNATMDEYMDYEDEEDQDSMNTLLEYVDQLPLKTAVAGITVQKSEAMKSAHASAFITWRQSARKYKFAYYDPLAYKKGKKGYEFAEHAFVSSRFDQNIEFINLSQYCFRKTPEEFHCSQYIMNAEYCYVYSVFFLHKWIEYGAKLDAASLQQAVTATYIVEPSKLTRSDNRESMIYRVVMMAFICSTFLKYLRSLNKTARQYIPDADKHILSIQEYLVEFRTMYGFDLIKGATSKSS